MLGLITRLYLYCLGATVGAALIQILIFVLFIFSIIGIVSTVKFFAGRKKKDEDPHQKWLRTGKM